GLAAVTVTGRRSKSRRSAPRPATFRPATFGPPNSVTQEQRDGAVFEEALRRRAEEQLLQPRGGVGAGDDEVGVGLGGVAEDALAHGAVLDARRPDAAVAVGLEVGPRPLHVPLALPRRLVAAADVQHLHVEAGPERA